MTVFTSLNAGRVSTAFRSDGVSSTGGEASAMHPESDMGNDAGKTIKNEEQDRTARRISLLLMIR